MISGSARPTSATRAISRYICTGACPTSPTSSISRRFSAAIRGARTGARCTRARHRNWRNSTRTGMISVACAPPSTRRASSSTTTCASYLMSMRQFLMLAQPNSKPSPNREDFDERCPFFCTFICRLRRRRFDAGKDHGVETRVAGFAARGGNLGGGDVTGGLDFLQYHPTGRAGGCGCAVVLRRWLRGGPADGQPVQRDVAGTAVQRLGLYLCGGRDRAALGLSDGLARPHRHRAGRAVLLYFDERQFAGAGAAVGGPQPALELLVCRGHRHYLRPLLHRHAAIAER